ncbi:2-hydroxyglutaryl-CoA dehydratase [Clostridia bacterium]|nr:2-hydroxyglutaryl-CoA dehydratase [Clostridia bacterium]
MNKKNYTLGIDIGSTTVKIAILDASSQEILFSDYARHYAKIQETLARLLNIAKAKLGECLLSPVLTGSGGMGLAKALSVPFEQEVVCVAAALEQVAPQTDVAIELGGEDAKIIYFDNGIDQRMNGICAGGTGSFIDQMASLLQTDALGLNEYAKHYTSVYPIAARCGVFAKSDVQPLMNEGATKEDLAVSIFQAVVTQTISGLACGKPIRGKVAFLGGPLHFLSELKQAFIRSLELTEEEIVDLPNSHLFAAIGSALHADLALEISLERLEERLLATVNVTQEIKRLEPLFSHEREYEEFLKRQENNVVRKGDLSIYEGNCYLGIDAGSTTTKVALISQEGELLYSFYSSNEGKPLETTLRAMKEIRQQIPDTAKISYTCSTGYGEALIKAALLLDEGEVETVAHYYAAAFFEPEVDCILDIGGQDMKFMKIKQNTIEHVQLNEACSAGCGSFIETFAQSLDYPVKEFAKIALFAKNPIDLGTRCTVFMNSNVKQAQKEGAQVSDIAAGLAYSVIKNALFKVIKLTKAKDLGRKIVVQGGTFYNDAVLRSFELITEGNVIRPDIAGIMGAFGAALIARERFAAQASTVETSLLSFEEMDNLTYETSMARCGKCNNQCRMTVSRFSGNRRFITGNRCERGLGKEKAKETVPNLFAYKYERTFAYEPLPVEEAKRGKIGLPRVLNFYENYPFWAVFFRELSYHVVLSPDSTKELYEMGMESIPSESECYPAKLVHGHVTWLIRNQIPLIFYPCVPYEHKETEEANNHYNCPIVTSYPENIKNNVEELKTQPVQFLNPFLAFTSEEILLSGLLKLKGQFGATEKEIKKAAHKAWEELFNFKTDVRKKGEEALEYIEKNGKHGIVLAGRPYHVDPEIHHGIPDLISSYDIAVFTEDSLSHLAKVDRPTVVNDQWMYHSRLYLAASYVKDKANLDIIQLNSFGCGLDSVTCTQVNDILSKSNKIYTSLKIDEVNNLGAARIRIRSLIAALKERKRKNILPQHVSTAYERVQFTKEMKDYTILCPQLSPIHFDFLEPALHSCGYQMVVLQNESKAMIDLALQYVNNDACYPAIIVIGQILEALFSGKYDVSHSAIFMTQTGGGCRASNYIGFLRKALEKAGFAHIPVISVNANGMETNEGFHFTPTMVMKIAQSLVYGDVLMRVLYATRPYEKTVGSANALYETWKAVCMESLLQKSVGWKEYKQNIRNIIRSFDALPVLSIHKPKVGVVGEILVKFLPSANNHIVELLEAEGAEAVLPDFMDFLMYCFYNNKFQHEHLGKKKTSAILGKTLIGVLEYLRKTARVEFENSRRFYPAVPIEELAHKAQDIVSMGNQTGEGWFLTAEMLELIDSGVNNIVCVQPFGCLPNHIVGKGVMKEIKHQHEYANIVAIDYDPGASEVNQLNRIKLMLSTAYKNLDHSGSPFKARSEQAFGEQIEEEYYV